MKAIEEDWVAKSSRRSEEGQVKGSNTRKALCSSVD